MRVRWKSPRVLGVIAAASVIVLCAVDPALLRELELRVFDQYQREWPRPYRQAPVRVVAIDDESLSRLGQWPWPRSVIADLVTRLADLGAAAIAMDIVFAEPDRLSPARLAERWPKVLELDAGRLRSLDTDRILAQAATGNRVVGGFALTRHGDETPVPVKAGFAQIGVDALDFVAGYPAALRNIPVLEDAFAGLGSFSVLVERGSVVRRLPLLQRRGGQLVPSLSLEALRVASGADAIAVRGGADPRAGVQRLRVGGVEIPVTRDARMWLHDTGPVDARVLPAWRLFAPPYDIETLRSQVRGHVVFIGTGAAALGDRAQTPLRLDVPAVTVHAQALEQMLLGWHLDRPIWARAVELLAAAIVALVLVALLPRLHALGAAAVALGLALVPVAAAATGFARYRLLLNPLPAILAIIAVFLAMTVALYLLTELRRRGIQRAFGQFLAPALVERLAEDPARLRLGGETREMTFLFSDIAGFTALTETTDPERLVAVVNAYLDGACRVVLDHGGTIDKIVGDALHVMFNAPMDQPDHATRAVRCALALQAFSVEFRDSQRSRGIAFGDTRIGINSGTAVVGNFGGSGRFDYTAHGDPVNTAARLEAANKVLGTTVCVAAGTVRQCEGIAFRPVGVLWLRGKTAGTDVFEPLPADSAALAWRADYVEAYEALRTGGADAARRFEALSQRCPDDPLVALHAARIDRGESGVDITVA